MTTVFRCYISSTSRPNHVLTKFLKNGLSDMTQYLAFWVLTNILYTFLYYSTIIYDVTTLTSLSRVRLSTQFLYLTLLSVDRSARLEQFAIQHHCVRDTRHLQVPAEVTSLPDGNLPVLNFTECVSGQKSAFSPLQEKLCVASKNDCHLLELSRRSLSTQKVCGRSNYARRL